ncbi:MAG: hypothetical protein M0Z33_11385 [Actinomycetota bacterium]|nr:hypothetical protein [Actinomycetota bacterium]
MTHAWRCPWCDRDLTDPLGSQGYVIDERASAPCEVEPYPRTVVVLHEENDPPGVTVASRAEFVEPRSIRWQGDAVRIKDRTGHAHYFDGDRVELYGG